MLGSVYDQHAGWYTDIVQRRGLLHLRIIPQIMVFIGNVSNQSVIDVGCGEGVFTRELAKRGAIATGVDLSKSMLGSAELQNAVTSIPYVHDDGRVLSKFSDNHFDGAICVMALMDIDDIFGVFRSVHRVTRHGGWFVAVLTHPCFDPPDTVTEVVDGIQTRSVSRYLTEGYWRGNSTGVRSRMGAYHRTLGTYLNLAIEAGWNLDQMMEPELVAVESGSTALKSDLPGLLMLRFSKR
jgi:ubiquinone/menaquinone biosynthesis C-methylase UbiE